MPKQSAKQAKEPGAGAKVSPLVLAIGHSTRPIENFIRCYKRTVWRVCDRCAGIPAENILAF